MLQRRAAGQPHAQVHAQESAGCGEASTRAKLPRSNILGPLEAAAAQLSSKHIVAHTPLPRGAATYDASAATDDAAACHGRCRRRSQLRLLVALLVTHAELP